VCLCACACMRGDDRSSSALRPGHREETLEYSDITIPSVCDYLCIYGTLFGSLRVKKHYLTCQISLLTNQDPNMTVRHNHYTITRISYVITIRRYVCYDPGKVLSRAPAATARAQTHFPKLWTVLVRKKLAS
jgi:hypothetical protein